MGSSNSPGRGKGKKLILNAFVESCSGHQSPGLWSHPRDKSTNFNDIHHWVELAKLLEKGKFHGIFIADVLVSFPQHLHRADGRVPTTCTKDQRTPTRPLFPARNGPSMNHWP